MRTLDEILQTSPKKVPFSNGSSWEIWSYAWCRGCVNDEDENCPLIAAAMLGVTPREWVTGTQHHDYQCGEFQPTGGLAA